MVTEIPREKHNFRDNSETHLNLHSVGKRKEWQRSRRENFVVISILRMHGAVVAAGQALPHLSIQAVPDTRVLYLPSMRFQATVPSPIVGN